MNPLIIFKATPKNLLKFIAETEIEELMVSSNLFDREAKLKSFSLLHDAMTVQDV